MELFGEAEEAYEAELCDDDDFCGDEVAPKSYLN